jgi:hypothetical protein
MTTITLPRAGASLAGAPLTDTRARGIAVFLLIAIGGAWSVWGLAWMLGVLDTGPRGQVVVALGAFAPAAAAFIVRRWVTREGFADAGLRLSLRRAWPYYLFAWLFPLPVVGVIIALAAALGLPFVRTELPPALVLGALGGVRNPTASTRCSPEHRVREGAAAAGVTG